MSEELKPCPFCAGKPYAQENGRMGFRYWEVVCDNECDFTGPAKDSKEQAVEAWNRRDPDAAKDAEIEALNALVTSLSEELAGTYEELIDHNGDDLNDTRAKRVAALKGDAQ